jgi:hypothetical protein
MIWHLVAPDFCRRRATVYLDKACSHSARTARSLTSEYMLLQRYIAPSQKQKLPFKPNPNR